MKHHVSPIGLAIAVIVGALAAMLACGVWSLIATVAGGQQATLPLSIAVIAGALQAVGFLLVRSWVAGEGPALVLSGLGALAVFLLLSGGGPFGIPANASLFWGYAGSVIVFGCVTLMIRGAFHDLNTAEIGRAHV